MFQNLKHLTSITNHNINDLEILKSKLTKFMPKRAFFGINPASTYDLPPSSDNALTSATDTQDVSLAEAVSFSECYDISKQSFKHMMDIYCHNLSCLLKEFSDIEKVTHVQFLQQQLDRVSPLSINSLELLHCCHKHC